MSPNPIDVKGLEQLVVPASMTRVAACARHFKVESMVNAASDRRTSPLLSSGAQPCEFTGFGAMDVSKPYRFIRFGAMDVTKPYGFIRFGAQDFTKPSRFIGFGARDVTKPYRFIGVGAVGGPGIDDKRCCLCKALQSGVDGPCCIGPSDFIPSVQWSPTL